jgi:magnesium-transporting ATPase (P-type)
MDREHVHESQEHLRGYAENGYRTLCFSMRTIPNDVYTQWNKQFYDASVALENRDKLLADVAELIETDLILIGTTAIEDKLQDVS